MKDLGKPLHLRQETWDFLKPYLIRFPISEQSALIEQPGPLLLELGLLTKPHLLRSTVIEMPNEVEYLITPAAAEDLAAGAKNVTLTVLYDQRHEEHARSEIADALKNGPVFDQLDR